MGEINFSEVDVYGSEKLKQRVTQLVASELGGTRSAETILRTIDYSSGTTRVVGGFVGDELVSMNAFMRMRFAASDRDVVGFQSGFSATDSSHRGKGYWPKLMAFAEQHLAGAGASFIFGFPNPISHPLFVKKLGYTSLSLYNLRIPCIPVLFDAAFNADRLAQGGADAYHPDFGDNLAWKKRSDDCDSVILVEEHGSALWGKVRHGRKFGLPIRFLEVGTFDLAPRASLKRLFQSAARDAGAKALYVSMNSENAYFGHLGFKEYGQPVIVKTLADDLSGKRVNFFGGMRDTF